MKIQWQNLTDFAKSIFLRFGLMGIDEYNRLRDEHSDLSWAYNILYEMNLELRKELRQNYKSLVPMAMDFDINARERFTEEVLRVTIEQKRYTMQIHRAGFDFVSMDPDRFDWIMRDCIDEAFHMMGRSYLEELKKIILTEINKDYK